MAADVKARQDRNATIAFTLPISCQICLGKVKQPVLCPNNHVFCSQCMDVWLQRNKQCPSCRVHITPANPVKKIISGLNDCGEDKERLSNPELRKSRFDLLFKEYEEEIQRLESESQLLKTENEVLQQQLQKTGGSKYSGSSRDGSQPRQSDTNGILVLNKKLQDAQKLHEKIKSELSKVKQENNSLKDENVNLNRENQKLRQEIGNRSPHRYGRYTVATLESKVQSYEKEVDQLNKALERSDRFIEELQNKQDRNKEKESGAFSSDRDFAYPSKPVRSYSSRSDTNASSVSDLKANHKRQLFNEEDEDSDRGSSHRGYVNGESYKGLNEPDQSYKSYDTKSYESKSNSKNRNGVKSTKKVTFDLPKDRNETMSFDLEMPSPLKGGSLSNGTTPSPVKGVLKNGKRSNLTNGNDSLNLSKPHSLDDSYGDNRQTTSNKRVSDKDSGRFYNLRSSGGSKFSRDDTDMYKKTGGERSDLDVSGLSESFNLDYPSRTSHKYNHYDREFDDTDAIQTELDELDISMTPDFTDCMKLLNRAEKKVHSDSRKPSYQVPDDPLMDIYKPSRDLHDNYTSSEPKVDSVKSETGPLYGDYKPSTAGYTDTDNYTSKYFLSSESKYDLPSKQGSSYKAEGDIPLSNYTSSTAQISTYKSGASDSVHTSDLPLSNYTSSSLSNYKTNSVDSDPVATNVTGGRYSLPFDKTEANTSSSDKYSIPTRNDDYIASSSGKYSLPTTNVSEKFRSAALDNFGLPSDSGKSKYTGTDIHTSKGSFETGSSASGNLYGIKPASTPDRDFLAARPLTQSGFGRSPSVDNLFMSSKTSTQVSGSRYATAEDIPSDFRSRRSLPAYPSSTETGRLPLSAASDVAPGSRDYVMSSLPPKPVRTRSQSDLGTSVASLASSSAYQRGRGKTPDVVSVPTFSVTNSTDTLPSYSSSSSQSVPTSLSMSYAVPSAAGTGSSSAHYLDVGKYSAPVPAGASIASSLTTNRLTTTSTSLGLSGPVKAKTGYSYTDFDLGVNPKSKSKLDLPLTTRVRSNSLDIPVDKLSSYDSAKSKPYSDVPFDNKASNFYDTRKPSYSYSDSVRPSVPYASAADPESAYAISLTGAPQPRSAALEDNIPSKAPGMSSSKYSGSSVSSSTSYLPSSLTSVTSSSTYSSSGTVSSSSSYQPAYSIPSSSTYIGGGGGKSLDPIHEASSKGYSYLSNNSSVGDISRSDSFLPEPKKRLFDSTDDLDMSLSPIKTTRKI